VSLVEVYRSAARGDCDERALVLQAVGIPSQVGWDGREWLVAVDEAVVHEALAQIARYERENPRGRRVVLEIPSHPHAWIGSAAYAAVLLCVGYFAGLGAFGVDWLQSGALSSEGLRAGEAWRAVTAQTLHLDVAHLLANLGFGTIFGLFAGQLLGPGIAWVSVLVAATLANLLNALLRPEASFSVGASTTVFATLGLLSAFAWRRRAGVGERWAYRWAPLVAGIALLAFTGAGGERTDVLAHLTGFVAGLLAGWLHAGQDVARYSASRASQWIAGVAALAVVALSWTLALLVPA
jgi:membrane associated rhomboid family serine protease